jgi:hypothetical protein
MFFILAQSWYCVLHNTKIMNILNLFKKKKKTAKCQLTDMVLTNGEGCLVTTSEVIQSRKFWESKMTEPETMSYTINYFKSKDKTSALIRNAIFEKYAEKEKVWIISEDCIQTYDINTSLNGIHVKEWWEKNGNVEIKNSGKAINVLSTEDYDKAKKFATEVAGIRKVTENKL